MATYNEYITSNYFKVKDLEEFKKDIECIGLEDMFVIHDDSIAVATYDGLYVYNDEDDSELYEDNIAEFIQSHLLEGETVEIRAVGNEKLRYINAYMYFITCSRIVGMNVFDECIDKYNKMIENEDEILTIVID